MRVHHDIYDTGEDRSNGSGGPLTGKASAPDRRGDDGRRNRVGLGGPRTPATLICDVEGLRDSTDFNNQLLFGLKVTNERCRPATSSIRSQLFHGPPRRTTLVADPAGYNPASNVMLGRVP